MNKNYTLFICFLLLVINLQAQTLTLKGVVKDASGQALAGANVYEKGSTRGVTTDAEGRFTLPYNNANAIIVISFIGFETQEIKADGLNEMQISMVEGTTLSTIEIVGSRSLGRSATDTPAPVDVIDIQQVTSRTGQLDLNQLLQFAAPSFNSNRQTGSDGADHVDPASLRGLGPDQTLVLINGKRRHQSSLVNLFGSRGRGNTGTDLNTIPAAAIERIEILRDGAAAQYGSDAIAGVINIVLKTATDELSINANAGAYEAKYRYDDQKFDGLNYNLNANYGFSVGKGGFVNLTGDFNYRDHTNRANTDPNLENLARRQYGDPRMQNASFYLNSRFFLTAKTQLYVFGGTNYRKGDAYAWTRFADSPRNVPSIYPNGFDPIISSEINDNAITAGLRTLWKGWDIDLYNTFGANKFHYFVNNTLNTSLGANSPTSFDAGGYGLNQNNTGLKFNRFFKNTLKGLNLAFGTEFRTETYNIFAGEEGSWKNYDASKATGSQGFPGYQPSDEIKESRTNFGVFADVEADVTKSLLLAAALRFENYSDFGSTLTGKLASRLKLGKYIALRASASTGFRAPSLAQINFNSTFTNFVEGQPVEILLARNNSAVTKALGIPELKQETSTNFSFGFTATPTNNLSITIDGYYVKVKDRVVLTGQFSDEDEDIGGILQDLGVGAAQFFTNAVSTSTKGLDIILAYSPQVGQGRLNLSLAANFNELTIDKVQTNAQLAGKEDTYFDLRERYFLRASAPPSKINFTADYGIKKFNFVLRLVRFGEIKLANFEYDENKLDIYSAKITTDLSVRYAINDKLAFTIGGQNIFNVYPDLSKYTAQYTESGGGWDPVQMGSNGRYYFVRLGFKMPTKKK